MNSLAGFVLSAGASIGFVIGLVHIGFAMTEPYPRNIWDWYVVAMGFAMLAMAYPAALYIGEQMAKQS